MEQILSASTLMSQKINLIHRGIRSLCTDLFEGLFFLWTLVRGCDT